MSALPRKRHCRLVAIRFEIRMRTISSRMYMPLIAVLLTSCWKGNSQPTSPKPLTETGAYLLSDAVDLRRNLFDSLTIDSRTKRGVVALIGSTFSSDRSVREYSTNTWRTVSDAVRSLGKLERQRRTPQIRIVQRDAIFQSTVAPYEGSRSGFDAAFLARPLKAGDIVILTLISE